MIQTNKDIAYTKNASFGDEVHYFFSEKHVFH